VAELERMARSHLARDGVAQFAAAAADGRQVAHLRRLRARLAADPELEVFFGDRPDGAVYLTVYPAGARRAAVWGVPRHLDDPDPDPDGGDFWGVKDPDDA